MNFLKLLKKTYLNWDKNDPWAKSAIIAYYALFSLPSLLMITVHIAGIFFGTDAVRGRITKEIGGLIGKGSAEAIEGMIANATIEGSSTFTIVAGVAMLVFSATGVFFQLQKALNDIWSVRAKKINIKTTLIRRATSFGVVLAIGFLLLISLMLSAIIGAFSEFMSTSYSQVSSTLVDVINFIISQLFITALFGTIFKILPDVHLRFRTTLIGAFMTSLLFLGGKYLIGFYFSESNPASVYGAAGSVVLILLWVYYSCLILFFGAEFTVQWALFKNIKVTPTDNAVPSFEKEIEELRAYKKRIEEKKQNVDTLASNNSS